MATKETEIGKLNVKVAPGRTPDESVVFMGPYNGAHSCFVERTSVEVDGEPELGKRLEGKLFVDIVRELNDGSLLIGLPGITLLGESRIRIPSEALQERRLAQRIISENDK